MENKRPLIFISNDDSYKAPGIKFLIEIARSYGDVFVAAPESPQSGKSSSITMEQPIRSRLVYQEEGLTIYAINGTPVDCIKLALNELVPRLPDYIFSGMNHGYNSGNCVTYSGTMGVVFEGSFYGIPSMGFSYGSHDHSQDLSACEPIIRQGIELLMNNSFQRGICFNLNIPTCEKILGLKPAINARGRWMHEYEKRIDPFGKPYYWTTGSYVAEDPDNPLNEVNLLDQGYATIAPCTADQTHFDSIAQLNDILK